MGNPVVSVVVPTYNRHEMLRNALRSLIVQETDDGFSYEIVVIDNGSTPHTRAVVEESAADSPVALRYVREEVEGIPHAVNRGVQEARGSWIAFFDDDQLAEPKWLRELLSAAAETKAKLVGGSIKAALPREKAVPLGPVCRSLCGEHVYEGTARICRGKSIPSGGNLLVAREVFDSLGLFDTSMAAGGCDADLVRRALASGVVVAISPTALVHHVLPIHRLIPSYFRWTSMRWGYQFAFVDRKTFGRGRMLCRLAARIGQAMLVNAPLLLISFLTRNATASLDRKCLLWRAIGYARGAASLAAPQLFKEIGFFSQLEFRRERTRLPAVLRVDEYEAL